MQSAVLLILDAAAIAAALLASWLWYLSSRNRVRRVARDEELNAIDINRIVVAINRSQILNAQAALVTAVSAVAVALRMITGLVLSGP
jgi:hypothetical protein